MQIFPDSHCLLPIIHRSGESPADSTSTGFHLCSSLTWKCFHHLWDSLTLSNIQCFLARTVLIRSLNGKIGLFDESPVYLYLSLSPYVQQTIFKMLISRPKKKSQCVVGIGGGGAGEQEIKDKLLHKQYEELPKIFVVFRITYQKWRCSPWGYL